MYVYNREEKNTTGPDILVFSLLMVTSIQYKKCTLQNGLTNSKLLRNPLNALEDYLRVINGERKIGGIPLSLKLHVSLLGFWAVGITGAAS